MSKVSPVHTDTSTDDDGTTGW